MLCALPVLQSWIKKYYALTLNFRHIDIYFCHAIVVLMTVLLPYLLKILSGELEEETRFLMALESQILTKQVKSLFRDITDFAIVKQEKVKNNSDGKANNESHNWREREDAPVGIS